MRRCTTRSGFGVVEVLVVIAIITIVAAMGLSSFVNTNKSQALEKDVAKMESVLNRARSLTLSSSGDQQYGVHLAPNQVVIFPGNVYASNNPANQIVPLNSLVTISSYALAGGGSDIVFDRLTGKTVEAGTITVSLIANPVQQYVITVLGTGLVQIN